MKDLVVEYGISRNSFLLANLVIDNFEMVNSPPPLLAVFLSYRFVCILQLDYHFLEDVLQSKLRGKRLLQSTGIFPATNSHLALNFTVCLIMSRVPIRSIVDSGK